MRDEKEISALLQLVDDPDNDVFDTVAAKLLHYGKDILPNLEQIWESTSDELIHERVGLLIHRVHYNDLQKEFIDWSKSEYAELLHGAILVAKYQFPTLDIPSIHNQVDQIIKNIWLELNNYLTPLEQINVINSILYNYYKYEGRELTERESRCFFINNLFDYRQGNAYSIGLLYLVLCERLDIPVFAVDVPKQFLLAYIDTIYSFLSPHTDGIQQVQFYLDPTSGLAYTQSDIDLYLKKIEHPTGEINRQPLSNQQIVHMMLSELSMSYRFNNEDAKSEEIQHLMQLVYLGKQEKED